jgi:small subunit ribosomal protein S13
LTEDTNPNEKKSEEKKEEKIESEIQNDQELKEDTKIQEKSEEKIETPEQVTEEKKIEEKTEEKPIEDETKKEKAPPEKPDEKKEEKLKKKSKHGADFKYIVRLSNTDINGEKNVIYGLTGIKGVGLHLAMLIADKTGIERYKKIGDLSDSQIEKIQEFINRINENAPKWMLNHRKDLDTGKNIHLIGSDIDMRLRDEINIMKKIRSYRGIRHERGLRVRGQRTKANNRRGLALGVSKKRD